MTEGIDAVVKVKVGKEIEVWTLDTIGRRGRANTRNRRG